MSTPVPEPVPNESLELPVEKLLRRARPLPPYDEMVIDDLTPEEAEAFLAAVLSDRAPGPRRCRHRRLQRSAHSLPNG